MWILDPCRTSSVTWDKTNWETWRSIQKPSELVMSSKYQLLDFALKSPIIIVKKGLLVDSESRFIFRFDLKSWNSSCVLLEDLKGWMKQPNLLPILTSKLIHLLRFDMFKILKEGSIYNKYEHIFFYYWHGDQNGTFYKLAIPNVVH